MSRFERKRATESSAGEKLRAAKPRRVLPTVEKTMNSKKKSEKDAPELQSIPRRFSRRLETRAKVPSLAVENIRSAARITKEFGLTSKQSAKHADVQEVVSKRKPGKELIGNNVRADNPKTRRPRKHTKRSTIIDGLTNMTPNAVKEEEEGNLDLLKGERIITGTFRGFNSIAKVSLPEIIKDAIAWTPNAVQPLDVGDGGFKYAKFRHVTNFFEWGLIELRRNRMKPARNTRYMHMLFIVLSGKVRVRVHDCEFELSKQGIWHVARGNPYSITNIGSGSARIFFSQAMEPDVDQGEEVEALKKKVKSLEEKLKTSEEKGESLTQVEDAFF